MAYISDTTSVEERGDGMGFVSYFTTFFGFSTSRVSAVRR
jgi:hypothetical protein